MATSEASQLPYTCTLSPELMKKAETELKERPEWRNRDIQALRDMVKKNKDLICPTDDAYLLRFLRARKFDYERAYTLIISHFQQRNQNPDVYNNLTPSAVKHVLEAGVTTVLPDRDKEGRRVLVFRPGKWDPDKFPITDVIKTNVISLMKIIQEEETQVNGVIMLGDMTGLTMYHARHMIPNAKKISSILQDSFPARFKGLHYVNEPSFIGYVFDIIKRLLSEKMQNRVHFHASNYKGLHEFVSKETLPSDFDGEQPELSNKEWMDKLLASEAEYIPEATFKLIETKAVISSQGGSADTVECLTGTYRKLNVD